MSAALRLVVQHASVSVSTDDATLDADCSLRSEDGVTVFPPTHDLMLGAKFTVYSSAVAVTVAQKASQQVTLYVDSGSWPEIRCFFSRPLSVADIVSNDLLAARGAAIIDVLLLLGIAVAVLLSDKVGRMKLQVIGFIGCAAGLLIAAQSAAFADNDPMKLVLIFAGFMLFNFMTNLGPNAQTYLIAGEVFPTRVRAKGAGFAASFAKIGACTTAFLFPILLADIGTQALLYILVGSSLIGALVTWLFRIETKGVKLDTVGVELQ